MAPPIVCHACHIKKKTNKKCWNYFFSLCERQQHIIYSCFDTNTVGRTLASLPMPPTHSHNTLVADYITWLVTNEQGTGRLSSVQNGGQLPQIYVLSTPSISCPRYPSSQLGGWVGAVWTSDVWSWVQLQSILKLPHANATEKKHFLWNICDEILQIWLICRSILQINRILAESTILTRGRLHSTIHDRRP